MRVHEVKKARKDYPAYGIKKGEFYFWWKFRNSPKRMSKTYPKRSQLTQSDFLQELYDLEDNLEFDGDDLEGSVSELVSQLEELRDNCQESLDNMPEHLQESSESGQILQERIDALDEWINNLESVDLEVDEELDEEEKEEKIQSILDELNSYSSGL